ncbi:hypothetical protein BDN71DRAFT_1425886 [Pleurotus eryngii]|uniref:Uncharacterized protein n=1 Tax=Pleurotus eryngii TaxID=5323 RepID=A0A9P6AA51_PLEER|nr:hypothetical protein BDN71DRAFT_1425886 [Pleurotus eryngii]
MSDPNQEPQQNSRLSPQPAVVSTLQRLTSFSRSKKPALVFPPPSWGLDDEASHDESSSATKVNTTSSAADGDAAPPPESANLAQTIRNLIDSLPSVSLSSRGVDTPVNTEVDPKGPPVPDGVDKKLMAWLSSEAVMNGYMTGKDSVFGALDRLKHPLRKGDTPKGEASRKDEDPSEQFGTEGIMMYTPLVPTNESHIVLAEEEEELEYIDPEELERQLAQKKKEQETASASGGTKPGSKSHFWSFGREKKSEVPQAQNIDTAGPSRIQSEVKPKHIWVPSETDISVQVMWWGYRIYLPPPVIRTLDSGSIAATKRAAMITAALKWMLDKIPQMLVPPTFRPALALFKRLAPFAGYIGVFIAWSWKSIKANDKGGGVTLTATWLLTVALIPSSWEVTPERSLAPVPGSTPTSSASKDRKK